jgi:hypothetical protein
MMKHILFLLSFFITSAFAETSVTGFAYTTQFGDHDWHDPRTIVSVNVDYFNGAFAARTQLSTFKDQTIRRAVLEYSIPLSERIETTFQVGRFSRLDSFYEGITDSPANYRQAILPFAGYSFRMLNGTFTLMDGIKNEMTFKTDHVLYKTKVSYGKANIPRQTDLHYEAFNRLVPGYTHNSTSNNYDISGHMEMQNWHLYVSRNHYRVTGEADNNSPIAKAVFRSIDNMEYYINKIGVQYANENDFVAQVEWYHGITKGFSASGRQTASIDSVGYNYMVGKCITDSWFAYVGRSYGNNKVTSRAYQDNYIGVTKLIDSFTISAEWHIGSGREWKKHTSPISSGEKWNTYVLTLTYRF